MDLSMNKVKNNYNPFLSMNNIDNIHWCGRDTWIVQLGDQIDRCRPDDWEKNCIKDFNFHILN